MTQELRPAITRHDELIAAVRMVRMRRDGYARLKACSARHEFSRDVDVEKQCALQMLREAERDLADVVLAEMEEIK